MSGSRPTSTRGKLGGVRWLLAVVGLASGCAGVFGLHERTDDVDAPGSAMVTGAYSVSFIVNDPATFAPTPLQTRPYGPDELALAVVDDDGTTHAVPVGADGSFAFPVAAAGARYRLAATLHGGITVYDMDTPQLLLVDHVAGPPDGTPMQQPTTITFTDTSSPPPTGNDLLTFASTGVLADSALFAEPMPTADWKTISPFLLDGSRGDELFMVRDTVIPPGVDDPLQTVAVIAATAAFHEPILLVDGGAQVASGMLVGIERPHCVHIVATFQAERARFLAADLGDLGTTYTENLGATATPDQRLGFSHRNTLAFTFDQTGLDYDTRMIFGSPYQNMQFEARESLAFERTLGAIKLDTGAEYDLAIPSTGCPDAIFSGAASGIGIVNHAVVGSTPSVTDGDRIAIHPGDAVPLAWQVVGSEDFVTMNLFEVGAAGLVPRQTVTTTANSTLLLPGSLEIGKAYIVRFDVRIGAPMARAGNFGPTVSPDGDSTTWSHQFTVDAAP